MDRKTMIFAVCEALAAKGIRPTLAAVKASGMPYRGSDPDITRDCQEWLKSVLEQHSRSHEAAGIPKNLIAPFKALVDVVRAEAEQELAHERDLLQEREAQAQQRVDEAIQQAQAAADTINDLKIKLAAATETIAGRDETIRHLQESLAEARSILQAKDVRIDGLAADLARKTEEQKASQVELDGLRKHTLLQIDQARSEARHWKAEFDRVDAENKSTVLTYRQRAAALENELANARGRLSTLEEVLQAARKRTTELEAKLTSRESAERVPVKRLVKPSAPSRLLARPRRVKL